MLVLQENIFFVVLAWKTDINKEYMKYVRVNVDIQSESANHNCSR